MLDDTGYFARTGPSANRISSTGTGIFVEYRNLLAGIGNNDLLSVAEATIFSRMSAPPPPLMSRSSGSNSFAPTIVTSIFLASSNVVHRRRVGERRVAES